MLTFYHVKTGDSMFYALTIVLLREPNGTVLKSNHSFLRYHRY